MTKNSREFTLEGKPMILRQMLLSSKDNVSRWTIPFTKDQSNFAKRLTMLGSMIGISEVVDLLSKIHWIKFTIYRIHDVKDDA